MFVAPWKCGTCAVKDGRWSGGGVSFGLGAGLGETIGLGSGFVTAEAERQKMSRVTYKAIPPYFVDENFPDSTPRFPDRIHPDATSLPIWCQLPNRSA